MQPRNSTNVYFSYHIQDEHDEHAAKEIAATLVEARSDKVHVSGFPDPLSWANHRLSDIENADWFFFLVTRPEPDPWQFFDAGIYLGKDYDNRKMTLVVLYSARLISLARVLPPLRDFCCINSPESLSDFLTHFFTRPHSKRLEPINKALSKEHADLLANHIMNTIEGCVPD